MLKKIAIGSAILLIVALVAAAALLPGAVRAVIRDSDRLVSQFIRTTPVLSFPGDCAEVYVKIGGSVRVEQSPDDQIYLRVEGPFADRYQIASSEASGEDGKVLTLSLDNGDAFWDESRSYLFLRAIEEGDHHASILLVPSTVRVKVDDPWRLSLDAAVRFANADVYREGSWHSEEVPDISSDVSQRMQDRYEAMVSVLDTELASSVSAGLARGMDLEDIEEDIDDVVARHYERMTLQLFPYASQTYDTETLYSLLQSALTMRGQQTKNRLRLELGEGYDDYHERFSAEAERAIQMFEEVYRRYLEEIALLPEETLDGELNESSEPEEPGTPGVRLKPAESSSSAESSEPGVPAEAAESSSSMEAVEPVGPVEPAEPVEPAAPVEPVEPAEPTEPVVPNPAE